jgi:hypothetical protein
MRRFRGEHHMRQRASGRSLSSTRRLGEARSDSPREIHLTETMFVQADGIVSVRLPMDDQVRRRAYELWEADGRPHGQDQQYWFKAMAELAAAAAQTIKPPRKGAPRAKKAA